MNYQEALAYISGVEFFGSRPGLERIRELLEKLGNPQKGMKFIPIAGTNGKRSAAWVVGTGDVDNPKTLLGAAQPVQ